ncbi:tRNA epoxyqueuosine(34) reductase QueG [bacterium]|nr:tRNA epoxyqueuosine(34) reductase QueG [bacterium]
MNLDFEQFDVTDWSYTEESKPLSFSEFQSWIDQDMQGPLSYLSDHRKELREDVKNFYPEFESALVFCFSYHEKRNQINDYLKNQKNYNQKKIASYALSFEGVDYHFELKEKLKSIGEYLVSRVDGLEYALTLDVHPVLERDLAFRSGLGWFGKNSMMISTEHGSFFMLGSLLLNKKLPVPKKEIQTDHCGTCSYCVDACPTDAILDLKRQIDASKCISTYTIEIFKEESPPDKYERVEDEIYGCDICQDVCPWNKRIDQVILKEKRPLSISKNLQQIFDFFLLRTTDKVILELESLSNRGFQKKFKSSVFERTGRRGLLKNFKALIK